MPIRLTDLVNQRRTITTSFEVNGQKETFDVTYDPGWYSVEREEELKAMAEDKTVWAAERRARRLSELLIAWEVLQDDGTPYPTDYEALRSIDSNGFLAAVEKAITEDLYPNAVSGSASAASSSSAEAPAASSPTTTA